MRGSRGVILLAILLPVSIAPAHASGETDDVLEGALAYVAAQQGANGRWPLPSQGYATEAAAAAGLDPRTWPSTARPAFQALTPEACTQPLVPEPLQACYRTVLRVVHAAGVSGYDPRSLNGFDGVARVRAGFDGVQFGDPRFVNDDAWAILALRAAGVPASDAMIQAAVTNVLDARTSDGGWSDQVTAQAGDTDMTGMALAALAAAGRDMRGDAAAISFLRAHWSPSGAFSNGPIGPNVQSTAWAIHAMSILGIETNGSALDWIRSQRNDDGSLGNGLWPTTEAIVVLAGERYPFPSYAPLVVEAPDAHARENATLRAPGFLQATWTIDGVNVSGNPAAPRFDAAGSYPYRVVAEGDGTRARGDGVLRVLSARPTLGALPESVDAFRRANVTLDFAAASDPDGRVERIEVDWADGNESATEARALTHAYPLPGTYRLEARAIDDAGVASHPAFVTVRVANRAPLAPALPARIVADRIDGVALDVPAADPDGDAARVRWRLGTFAGEGRVRAIPPTLGNHTLLVTVEDAFGANATSQAVVEVLNTPPTIALRLPTSLGAGDALDLLADAADPDGAAPSISWLVDGEAPSEATVRLAPGEHVVRAIATDADGATASATGTVVVRETAAASPIPAPSALAPEIRALEATFENGTLRVVYDVAPDNATALLRWRSDAGEGEARGESPWTRAIPGAAWAGVTLVASHDGIEVARTTPLLVARVDAMPSAEPAAAPEDVRVASRAETGASVRDDAPLESAGLSAGQRQTPAAPALAAVALALLAMRGRRAPRA